MLELGFRLLSFLHLSFSHSRDFSLSLSLKENKKVQNTHVKPDKVMPFPVILICE
jgi:hypothetical protein